MFHSAIIKKAIGLKEIIRMETIQKDRWKAGSDSFRFLDWGSDGK
jgi:hypothetical protein